MYVFVKLFDQNVRALFRVMEYEFDDTLFEASSGAKSETCTKCMYAPKQCEQEVMRLTRTVN